MYAQMVDTGMKAVRTAEEMSALADHAEDAYDRNLPLECGPHLHSKPAAVESRITLTRPASSLIVAALPELRVWA
jgi:hypothetical protein